MNKKFMINIISKIVMIEGILLILPALVGFYYKEKDAFLFLALSIIVTLVTFLLSKIKPEHHKFYTKESLLIISFIWILWSLIGAIPLYVLSYTPKYIDAFFEIVSGFTTTGSTILTDIEVLSKSMLFWRSFTHWIGGMGVLVFVLAVIPLTDGSAMHLLRAEVPGPTVGKLVPKAKKTAMILYGIYFMLTLVEVILLMLGKMSLYEAMLHAFSTAGTGGFSTRNASIAAFNSAYIEYVISIFMLLFGINFNIYFYLLIRNFTYVFKNEELRYYIGIIIFAVATITFNIKNSFDTIEQAFRAALFQVSAIITTTGFVTQDFNLWPSYSKILLVLLMIMGACAGSTGGGIKVSRVLILFKEIKLSIKKLINPRIVNLLSIDNKKIELDVRHGTLIFIILYCLICVLSIMLISLNNFDFETTVTAVLTTLGNTGPGLGAVGPVENFAKFSSFSKIILSINMLVGRLEILPVVFLFSPSIWKSVRSSNK
ncbi:TrkH family potassium uptake protein [Streptobacillus felis]|uniref:TrkH family potassium uptake protein n=2 Tax=Streptobacillus TaxID=34104 RepID=A0A7Z0PG85_9FUSO|nr:TrkH family potassium uptake protein [Streptobacillus felis]NYV28201.1 TrkH family potassium uptake protein [Streptobacillus felis]